MKNETYIIKLLSTIKPSLLTENELYCVCKSLKSGGCPFSFWKAFCNQDTTKHCSEICEEIWNSFDNTLNRFAFVEIRNLAKKFGWKDEDHLSNRYLDVDGDIAIPYIDYLPDAAKNFPISFSTISDKENYRFVSITEVPEKYSKTEFIIQGLLQKRSNMLITAIPKAGKTIFSQQMTVCIAAGISFLGYECKKGKVLYLDAENNMYDSYERIKQIAGQLNLDTDSYGENIVFYDKSLVPYNVDILDDLIQNVKPGQFDVIILDPIYFLFSGDENNNKEINAFIKKVDNLGKAAEASVVLIHHETKACKFTKNVVDRASGSNIIARFPSTIVSITPIKAKKDTVGLREKLEIVLRFDKSPKPINIVLNDGIHRKENDIEATEGTAKLSSKASIDNKNQKFINAYNTLKESCETVKATDLAEYLNVARTSIYNYIKNTPGFTIEKGIIIKSECND